MYNLSELSTKELKESIKAWYEELDNIDTEYNKSYIGSEIHVQEKELKKRKKH